MKLTLIVTALIISFSACNNASREPVAATTTDTIPVNTVTLTAVQFENAGIQVSTPEYREMHSSLQVNGVLDVPPQNMVSVSIPVSGYLKKTNLIPGTRVQKGSVLAILEDQQYIQLQQDYLTAKEKLTFQAADYDRQKELNETKTVSDKIFQQAKADFQSQKILVRALGEKLRLIGINPEALTENSISRSINVYSPINGFVTKVNVNTGKYISPQDVLFELINPDDLHLQLTVFENDAARIKLGQKIMCMTNAGEKKYAATVRLITPSIGENRATEIHCHLEGNHPELLPGTFMTAEISLNSARVLGVPEDAVVKWENKPHVFLQEAPNRFKLVPVETGSTNEGFIEIRTPLPNQKIVTRNAYTLLMKMKNNSDEG